MHIYIVVGIWNRQFWGWFNLQKSSANSWRGPGPRAGMIFFKYTEKLPDIKAASLVVAWRQEAMRSETYPGMGQKMLGFTVAKPRMFGTLNGKNDGTYLVCW